MDDQNGTGEVSRAEDGCDDVSTRPSKNVDSLSTFDSILPQNAKSGCNSRSGRGPLTKDSATPDNVGRNVRNYTEEEDLAIKQYVEDYLKQDHDGIDAYHLLTDENMWMELQNKKVVDRSWKSIRNRYRKSILPRLGKPHAERADGESDCSTGFSRRSSRSSKNRNDPESNKDTPDYGPLSGRVSRRKRRRRRRHKRRRPDVRDESRQLGKSYFDADLLKNAERPSSSGNNLVLPTKDPENCNSTGSTCRDFNILDSDLCDCESDENTPGFCTQTLPVKRGKLGLTETGGDNLAFEDISSFAITPRTPVSVASIGMQGRSSHGDENVRNVKVEVKEEKVECERKVKVEVKEEKIGCKQEVKVKKEKGECEAEVNVKKKVVGDHKGTGEVSGTEDDCDHVSTRWRENFDSQSTFGNVLPQNAESGISNGSDSRPLTKDSATQDSVVISGSTRKISMPSNYLNDPESNEDTPDSITRSGRVWRRKRRGADISVDSRQLGMPPSCSSFLGPQEPAKKAMMEETANYGAEKEETQGRDEEQNVEKEDTEEVMEESKGEKEEERGDQNKEEKDSDEREDGEQKDETDEKVEKEGSTCEPVLSRSSEDTRTLSQFDGNLLKHAERLSGSESSWVPRTNVTYSFNGAGSSRKISTSSHNLNGPESYENIPDSRTCCRRVWRRIRRGTDISDDSGQLGKSSLRSSCHDEHKKAMMEETSSYGAESLEEEKKEEEEETQGKDWEQNIEKGGTEEDVEQNKEEKEEEQREQNKKAKEDSDEIEDDEQKEETDRKDEKKDSSFEVVLTRSSENASTLSQFDANILEQAERPSGSGSSFVSRTKYPYSFGGAGSSYKYLTTSDNLNVPESCEDSSDSRARSGRVLRRKRRRTDISDGSWQLGKSPSPSSYLGPKIPATKATKLEISNSSAESLEEDDIQGAETEQSIEKVVTENDREENKDEDDKEKKEEEQREPNKEGKGNGAREDDEQKEETDKEDEEEGRSCGFVLSGSSEDGSTLSQFDANLLIDAERPSSRGSCLVPRTKDPDNCGDIGPASAYGTKSTVTSDESVQFEETQSSSSDFTSKRPVSTLTLVPEGRKYSVNIEEESGKKIEKEKYIHQEDGKMVKVKEEEEQEGKKHDSDKARDKNDRKETQIEDKKKEEAKADIEKEGSRAESIVLGSSEEDENFSQFHDIFIIPAERRFGDVSSSTSQTRNTDNHDSKNDDYYGHGHLCLKGSSIHTEKSEPAEDASTSSSHIVRLQNVTVSGVQARHCSGKVILSSNLSTGRPKFDAVVALRKMKYRAKSDNPKEEELVGEERGNDGGEKSKIKEEEESEDREDNETNRQDDEQNEQQEPVEENEEEDEVSCQPDEAEQKLEENQGGGIENILTRLSGEANNLSSFQETLLNKTKSILRSLSGSRSPGKDLRTLRDENDHSSGSSHGGVQDCQETKFEAYELTPVPCAPTGGPLRGERMATLTSDDERQPGNASNVQRDENDDNSDSEHQLSLAETKVAHDVMCLLHRCPKATLPQIFYALVRTNGSFRDAYHFLTYGKAENFWTVEEDRILYGNDEEAIRQLAESKGVERTEDRIRFLDKRYNREEGR